MFCFLHSFSFKKKNSCERKPFVTLHWVKTCCFRSKTNFILFIFLIFCVCSMNTYVHVFPYVGISRHVCMHASGVFTTMSETILKHSSTLFIEAESVKLKRETPCFPLPGQELQVGYSAHQFLYGLLGI